MTDLTKRKKAIKQRMCVVCRGRFSQNSLLRLQVIEVAKSRQIVEFSGFGRSFYLCELCLESKNCEKILQKRYMTNITKEIVQRWQSKR